MRIVLARHGKPLFSNSAWIPGRELTELSRRYDAAGVSYDLPPPDPLRDLAASIPRILASDLERSVQSATWLAGNRDIEIDPGLREACLPTVSIGALRLPPTVWAVIARLAWLLNCGESRESLSEARARARSAARKLGELAEVSGSVLVIGHGIFNRLLAARLRALGWRGRRFLPVRHWSYASYSYRRG